MNSSPHKDKTICAIFTAVCAGLLALSGCGVSMPADIPAAKTEPTGEPDVVLDDHFGTTYEIFVYSFADSDGDGIGDLKGIADKIGYLNDGNVYTSGDLGVNALWLTPVFPSPTYHKYDATDYYSIDPAFGSLDEMDALTALCHERDMKLYLDLAINHTSDRHPWFADAAEYLRSLPEGQEPDPGDCPTLEYYNFTRTPGTGYEPLLKKDGKTETGWYYEARFWSGMPDLNLDSPVVRAEIASVMQFWLDRGIDGFRLDAVTSYHTDDHAKSAEFLSWLAQTAHGIKEDVYLVGEAWEGQSAYASFYETGVDSFFDFAFAGQEGTIAQIVRKGKGGKKFADQMAAEEELYSSYAPPGADGIVNAPFYTNHDMARSGGYYLKDAQNRIKLAQLLNLMQTGNAFVYYGEELGMRGSGKDENKRAPFLWAADDAAGERADHVCAGPDDMEDFEYAPYGDLETQAADAYSIWNYCRQAIHLRARHPLIARGKTVPSEKLSSDSVCAFYRRQSDSSSAEDLLILINLSSDSEVVDLGEEDYGEIGGEPALADALTVGVEEVTLEGYSLTLPGYGAAVLEMR